MVRLTEELILSKTRAESLAAVKNVNLWGSDLTDVSIIHKLTNVEVLSLSVNKISSLRDFRHCPCLTELYLRKNEIGDIREVLYLKDLKNLSILWLCDNPCVGASPAQYRKKVIALLPKVTKLDNIDVTEDERAEAEKLFKDTNDFEPLESAAPPSKKEQQQSERPATVPANPNHAREKEGVGAESAVCKAVLLLLGELTGDELRVVRRSALKRLQSLGQTD